jgi:hypothetical protein
MHQDALALKLMARDRRLSWSARWWAWLASTLALSMVNPVGDALLADALVNPLVAFARRQAPVTIWAEHSAAAAEINEIPGDEFAAIALASLVVGVCFAAVVYFVYRFVN